MYGIEQTRVPPFGDAGGMDTIAVPKKGHWKPLQKALKIALFSLGGAAGVLLLAGLAALAFVNVDAYRPQVEAAASRAVGMSVTVEGPMRIGFVPGLNVVLANVRIRNRGIEVAFVEKAVIAVALLPLLQRELRYRSITLDRARLSIERDLDGRYNYQKLPGIPAAFHALDLRELNFPNLVVVYTDRKSDARLEFWACSGLLTDMRHPGNAPFLMRLSLAGQFTCGEVRGMDTVVSELKLAVTATDGVFDFKPVTLLSRGGQGTGSLHMDRSDAIPTYDFSYSLSKFRVEEFFKGLLPGMSVDGRMDFAATLTMRGRTRDEMTRSASGRMSLSGADISLAGIDLDKSLSHYGSSQNFNLFDVSALFLAGPIGLLVTRGYAFSNLLQNAGGTTKIRTVVSRWKVEKGVAIADDVAMATGESRLALQGGLDFVDDEYEEVFVAVVDANGCAKARQRIRGPFAKPIVEKPSFLATLAAPMLNLLNIATETAPGTGAGCKVFYNGSVAAPK